jgi:aryl-alcohol dehydrogenase-like predicted oxidoreductase
MLTRSLGRSDLLITPPGFGTWAVGGAGRPFAWGHQDDGQSITAIHEAIDLGINWIDWIDWIDTERRSIGALLPA